MQTLARLFGRSPFAPLQIHMSKVAECVELLPQLFIFFKARNFQSQEAITEKISKLEHDADIAKNDICNHLPTGLFLPIDKENLLQILNHQDAMADIAEDIGVLLSLRHLEISSELEAGLDELLSINLEAFRSVNGIIQEFSELVESSFGGSEAEKVVVMVEEISIKEHASDVIQHKLLKNLFSQTTNFSYQDFILWLKIIQAISAISDESEKLANRIRMLLEVK